jgi:hypothetical protein
VSIEECNFPFGSSGRAYAGGDLSGGSGNAGMRPERRPRGRTNKPGRSLPRPPAVLPSPMGLQNRVKSRRSGGGASGFNQDLVPCLPAAIGGTAATASSARPAGSSDTACRRSSPGSVPTGSSRPSANRRRDSESAGRADRPFKLGLAQVPVRTPGRCGANREFRIARCRGTENWGL